MSHVSFHSSSPSSSRVETSISSSPDSRSLLLQDREEATGSRRGRRQPRCHRTLHRSSSLSFSQVEKTGTSELTSIFAFLSPSRALSPFHLPSTPTVQLHRHLRSLPTSSATAHSLQRSLPRRSTTAASEHLRSKSPKPHHFSSRFDDLRSS